jgi:hypothetical protein
MTYKRRSRSPCLRCDLAAAAPINQVASCLGRSGTTLKPMLQEPPLEIVAPYPAEMEGYERQRAETIMAALKPDVGRGEIIREVAA